jgi:MoxR-like ATPase
MQPNNNNTNNPSTIDSGDMQRAKVVIDKIQSAYDTRVVGQVNLKTALIIALISNGHVLLESVPGLAKTTAAKTLAESVHGSFHRIQCTPDLLPSDIIGTQIFNYSTGKFDTQIGPVHSNFVLLDEINRSSAKTQSAMLEAMQERQVSIGGVVYKMPDPFLVLATQNPIEQEGTYELPEAQLDRFLLKEIISYPTPAEELEILSYVESGATTSPIPEEKLVDIEDVKFLQQTARKIFVDDSIKQYVVNLIQATRTPGQFIPPELAKYVQYGSSPRGAISLMQVGTCLALLNGRTYVTPDDIKYLRHSVLRHRIILNFEAVADDVHSEAIIDAIFGVIQTP